MKKILIYIGIIVLLIGSLITILVFNENNNIYNSVVYIESIDEKTTQSGSGFVYKITDDKNYIITNYHVIEGYSDVYVYNNSKQRVKAHILNYDEYTDIAILTIEDTLELKKISIGNSDKVKTNDEIYAVGTPLNISNINTISEGIILDKNKKITINTTHGSSNLEVIQVNSKVDYGNSGGPLLNKNNEVIGMMFIKEKNAKDIGYALPINFVMNIVKKLENNELNRPNLGAVMCNTTNKELLDKYEINYIDIDGVVLLEVNSSSVLNNYGLKKGDVIINLNNIEINNVNELREELYKNNIGDIINIEYYRNEIYYKVDIEL